MRNPMNVTRHVSDDWCHICGLRGHQLADISYPENAEHGGPATRYLRMCSGCAQLVYNVALGLETLESRYEALSRSMK